LKGLSSSVITAPGEGKADLYLVATSHRDSHWNWTVQDTIRNPKLVANMGKIRRGFVKMVNRFTELV
jgi:hypothetical protein